MRGWSLSLRMFILTALWAVIAVSAVAFLVTGAFRASMEQNLDSRLTANLYNIMASVGFDEAGNLSGRPDLRDARYGAFRSGYYWSAEPVRGGGQGLQSASLAGGTISVPDDVPFNRSFERRFETADNAGNRLGGIEAQAFLGEGDDLVAFRITANLDEVEEEVVAFRRRLLWLLGFVALGFILVASLMVRIALAPLREATARLGDIREGRAERIEGSFPNEIQPFVDETNTLIESNRRVIGRARTQVGNLAHSLKTPLAVLRNEARGFRPASRELVDQQVDRMQRQIDTYLDRARIAAQAGTIGTRTPVEPVIARLVRVLAKLNPRLAIELRDETAKMAVFAGEQQDLEEMIGNLLENACKFAAHHITVTIGREEDGRLRIVIADDGPGMNGEETARAVKRGARLDETMPGSGLGLSIVMDIAAEYEGQLDLSRAGLGGLEAILVLPSAPGEAGKARASGRD